MSDSSDDDDDEMPLPKGIVSVCGAGLETVNGDYHFQTLFDGAAKYVKMVCGKVRPNNSRFSVVPQPMELDTSMFLSFRSMFRLEQAQILTFTRYGLTRLIRITRQKVGGLYAGILPPPTFKFSSSSIGVRAG